MSGETKTVQRIPFHFAVGILVAVLLIPGLFLKTWSFTNWVVFITWAEFFVFGATPAAWKRMIAPNAIGAVTAAVWMVNWTWFESLFKTDFQSTPATWLILAVTNFIWVVGIVYAIGKVKVLQDNGLSTFGGLTMFLAVYFSFLGGANFGGGNNPGFLVGTGAWQPDTFHAHDPVTGEMPAVGAISFGACVVEIEVDTETGVVDVNKLTQVWEVGKAVNPLMVRQQINGGLNIGLGYALTESTYPYWPSEDYAPEKMGDYLMPTFLDYPSDMRWGYQEVPHPAGVQGAKGFSEGGSNGPPPAIVAAIHDAIGVWVDTYPITPEVILRALEAKG